MYTLAIPLKLGRQKSFADGSTILKYINEAADEYKVRDHILQQKQ
jgi:cation diffusion facilitator CzcD-associated flavoprotein CzcO